MNTNSVKKPWPVGKFLIHGHHVAVVFDDDSIECGTASISALQWEALLLCVKHHVTKMEVQGCPIVRL
jgi:hypothetical protein